MKPFAYHRPHHLEEAVDLLARLGPGARVLAGGTDLVLRMKEGAVAVDHLIDLAGVSGLSGVSPAADGAVQIGALTTLEELAESPVIRARAPILSEAALTMACPEIRHLATVGGNLVSAVPSADLPPALLALGARVAITGPCGHRTVALTHFFLGPRRTCLSTGEVLSGLTIPGQGGPWSGTYLKHGPRGGMDLAVVGVAAVVIRPRPGRAGAGGSDGPCEVRLALGAVAPTPIRARRAETVAGRVGLATEAERDEVGRMAAEEASPISDMRASAAFRLHLVRVLTARALQACEERRGVS